MAPPPFDAPERPTPRTDRVVDLRDATDFEATYRQHRAAMTNAAAGLVSRPEAEHVVHDVLVDLWLHPERFRPERGALRTYLIMQTRSRAIDLLRSSTSRRRREETDASLRRWVELEIEHDGAREELRDALAALPEDERVPIVHAFFAGRTYVEVAAVLGIPEGTVKTRIRRGLANLRTHLAVHLDLDLDLGVPALDPG